MLMCFRLVIFNQRHALSVMWRTHGTLGNLWTRDDKKTNRENYKGNNRLPAAGEELCLSASVYTQIPRQLYECFQEIHRAGSKETVCVQEIHRAWFIIHVIKESRSVNSLKCVDMQVMFCVRTMFECFCEQRTDKENLEPPQGPLSHL